MKALVVVALAWLCITMALVWLFHWLKSKNGGDGD